MATSTKAKSAEPAPEYDFDNWSDEDEQKAIAAAVPNVQYIIVERTFVGRLTDETIVKVPLSLTLDEVDELQQDDATPIDQFKKILAKIHGNDFAAAFSARDMIEGAILAEKYFRVLQRVQQAAFPE